MTHRLPVRALILTACVLLAPHSVSAHSETETTVSSAQSSSAATSTLLQVWGGVRAQSTTDQERAAIVSMVDSQRLGQGSWICSPSGSGQTSHCSQR